jgi:hypothetical protein
MKMENKNGLCQMLEEKSYLIFFPALARLPRSGLST